MNSVHLVARIATAPTLAQHGDTTVATLRVAVQRPKRNGADQGADFFDVTAFGAQAENAVRYLGVGRRVAISGRLRQQSWLTTLILAVIGGHRLPTVVGAAVTVSLLVLFAAVGCGWLGWRAAACSS